MLPETVAAPPAPATRAQTLRLTSRAANLHELMDEPCTYEDLRRCLRDLAAVNRVTRSHHAVTQWLARMAGTYTLDRPLHIVDVGCGGGDGLRVLESWAQRASISVRLTGVDCNPHAIRVAREFSSVRSRITWVVGSAETLARNKSLQAVDVVVSSLVMHHLSDAGIVELLRWMEQTARLGWFVNDLYRTHTGRFGFAAMAMLMRWHRFVRHDGPVSFRRAFVPHEWRTLCAAAGVPGHAVRIEPRWPARIYVSRVRKAC